MRGRKPSSPKVKDLAAGTLQVVETDTETEAASNPKEKPPAWVKHKAAKELWSQLVRDLRHRHQYINLFEVELGRYCVSFGIYCDALAAMKKAKGPVVKSSKGVEMYSPHWVIANREHEKMAKLAADLGLNPVAQVRLAGLQLDLFNQPQADGDNVTPFAKFRQ